MADEWQIDEMKGLSTIITPSSPKPNFYGIATKACLHCNLGLFDVQLRLVSIATKPYLQCKQALVVMVDEKMLADKH